MLDVGDSDICLGVMAGDLLTSRAASGFSRRAMLRGISSDFSEIITKLTDTDRRNQNGEMNLEAIIICSAHSLLLA
jgi:hypothetical protein